MTPTTEDKESDNYQVPALDRALAIMELLAKHPEGMRMREIAEALSLPANSVFRITALLRDRGYLLRDDDGMRFQLSRKLLVLGYAAIGEDKLVEHAMETMQQLRDITEETVLIGVRVDLEGLVLEQVAATQPLKFLVDPGTRFPLHTSAPGKAIVAFLPPAEKESILSRLNYKVYTKNTITSRSKFEAELVDVQAQGYGVDRAEQVDGLHCLASPIFNHRGYPIASIWVTGPGFRFPEHQFDKIGKKVVKAAERISAKFGYKLL
jgi:DNA-binding IclR family transcriptional regulator